MKMSMKTKSFKIVKSLLCKLFWYLFIVQALIIIYFLAPKPCNPMIMIANDFATVDGPNLVQEGHKKNTYTIKVNKNLNQELNVTLKYSGTAQQGVDYIAPTHVTIKKGETSTNFNIEILDDPIAELNDAFALRIFTVTGKQFFNEYNVSNASNVIFTKIVDEKPPKNEDNQSNIITIDGVDTIFENNQKVPYKVTLSQTAIEDIDLNISYKGNAIYGIDYTAPKHITINKGASFATFNIKTIDDIYKEADEHIDVFISNFDDIGFEDIRYERSHFQVLLKDETPPSQALLVKLHAQKQAIENTAIHYTLSASEAVTQDISLPFSILSSDANIYKNDIIATLKKGEKSTNFQVTVLDDNIIEQKQKLELISESTQNDVYESIDIDMQDNTTDIVDNFKDTTQGALITLSSPSTTISEDLKEAIVSITSSQKVQQDLHFSIHYNGLAQNGIDFHGAKEATIQAGETTTTFLISPMNDNLAEVKETFSILIQPKSNGGLEKIEKILPFELTIADEQKPSNKDAALVSLTGSQKIEEANEGKYTVHFSQKLASDLNLTLVFIDNTAKASRDFEPLSTLSVPKEVQEYSFNVHTIDNEVAQTLRDFTIKLQTISGGGLEQLSIDPLHNSLQTSITDKIDIENAFKRVVASKKIVFAYAKADVDEKSFPILNDIAALLIQFPSVDLIVEGHTNSSGNRYRNKKLSKRRAKSVAEYLISQGVPKNRISSVGYGQSRPMVPDSNPKAQEINKRVEFKVKYRNAK